MSKGSKPRPFSVSNEQYAERWDAIFGKDKAKSALCPKCGKDSLETTYGTNDGLPTYQLSCMSCGHVVDTDYL